MTLRISVARSGCEVRRSVSVQPVQSCMCNQMTLGRFAAPTVAAMASGVNLLVMARPIGATTANLPQNERKFRRLTPERSRRAAIVSWSEGYLAALMLALSLGWNVGGTQRRKRCERVQRDVRRLTGRCAGRGGP